MSAITHDEDLDRTRPDAASLRRHVERTAAHAFVGCALVMSILCGAIIVAGWFAGVIDDRAERFFWAGAILGFVAIVILGLAALPGGDDDVRTTRRVRWMLRAGILLFLFSPALCIAALIADYYG
ncbi:hypothetical protein [Antiquaquibacter soli]|uniref:Uncharacterized protein n=1 Tax=Antiquaquibacter soli TaxID=3064523 RepID=A0ABT9BM17_9MICO|nr:hypothetical protein [Protaetiibacter sp. WY-16]MDO7880826.1 hypothetical protein [Protaetiibacter sp. WY-16]